MHHYHLSREHMYILKQNADSTPRAAIILIPEITTEEKKQKRRKGMKRIRMSYSLGRIFHQP